MTYQRLKEVLDSMTEEELNLTATIFVPGVDEYYAATVSYTDEDCDVLDPGHPVLTIE